MSNHSVKFYDRHDYEAVWVYHQPFLISRGYKLRPRYEPGWVGSWKQNGKDPTLCEDAIPNTPWNVIDAVRLSDNLKVSLKLVPTDTEQVPIALYLSAENLLVDPRNRSVPILDYVLLPANDGWGLLVMPFLREFDHPPFQFKSECIEFVGQMLEGLEFMHEHNVAHRDACAGNIMMDSTKLIPGGFHHIERNIPDDDIDHWDYDNAEITWTNRLSVQPMDYFFIDFGLSTAFSSFEDRKLVTGIFGRDKTVPELSTTIPYDPFRVDIYQLGGVIKALLETYHGLRFLRPLVESMMRIDPIKRPTASESHIQYTKIVSKLGSRALKARVIPYKDWLPAKILRAIRPSRVR